MVGDNLGESGLLFEPIECGESDEEIIQAIAETTNPDPKSHIAVVTTLIDCEGHF